MNHLHKRIIDISRKHGLSHLGSCLTACDIIQEIFLTKKRSEKFVLSAGHAGLALYVILEQYGYNAEKLLEVSGIHPTRMPGIDCSTGSLGQGIAIALGMAMADKTKNVYCLCSDGESNEGMFWESLRIKADLNIDNLKVYVNINGWGAYMEISELKLIDRILAFDPLVNLRTTSFDEYEFLCGQDAHYCVLKD